MNFTRFRQFNRHKMWAGLLIGFTSLAVRADSPADQAKLAAANTGFAFDLLKQIAKEQPDANVFISPFSVSSVLQMVGNGAAGETKDGDAARLENRRPPGGFTERSLPEFESIADFAAGRYFESGQWHLVSEGDSVETRLCFRKQKLFPGRTGRRGFWQSEVGGHHQRLGGQRGRAER